MKLNKLGILKRIIRYIPLPDVEEPEIEKLKYPESRSLYKLMIVLDYCFDVEDTFASTINVGGKKIYDALEYKKIFRKAIKFLIHLAEGDSFYRYRVAYALFFSKHDVFKESFYKMLVEKGFDKKWKPSDGVVDVIIPTGEGGPKSLFSHLPIKGKKKIKTEKF